MPAILGANSVSGEFQVTNGIRLNGSDEYLSRTLEAPTSSRTFTVSAWIKGNFKRSGSSDSPIMAVGASGDHDYTNLPTFIRTEGTPTIYISDTDNDADDATLRVPQTCRAPRRSFVCAGRGAVTIVDTPPAAPP